MEILNLRRKPFIGIWFFLALGSVPWSPAHAEEESGKQAQESTALEHLKKLPLEQLMDIEVTTVSKKKEKLSEAAAAIFVITGEDIRRSGATSIAEALRMAPGVEVGKANSYKWGVTVRGFNSVFARKLLVLIDGRSVYNSIFSGVIWQTLDTLLEDIDRIEVIRGPGGTLWGANAVNGVINIITKKAHETHGGLVSGGGGTEERGFGEARYGGTIGADFHYRTFAKYFNRDNGFGGEDDWWRVRGGMRSDWDLTGSDLLTFQGEGFDGNDHNDRVTLPTSTFPFNAVFDTDWAFTGGNFVSRWTHIFHEKSDLALQFYYDFNKIENAGQRDLRHALDLDFQYRLPWGSRQDIVWGAGYQFQHDNEQSGLFAEFNPPNRVTHLFSGFLQDEIVLIRDRLRLILGSKFEHNSFTGFEIQPTGRLLWTPDPRHTIWAAVSRAVRTPSRVEDNVRQGVAGFPDPATGTQTVVTLFGSPDFGSENLLASEAGYRVQPIDRLSFDFAAFYNRYTDLFTVEPAGAPFTEDSPPPPHIVVPLTVSNLMDGNVFGAELAAHWKVLDWWHLTGAYSFLEMQLTPDAASLDTTSEAAENASPRHHVSLRSTMDLPCNLEFDGWFRFVDQLPAFNIGSYVALDLRLGWKPLKNLEVSVVGQNLLDDHHPEFRPEIVTAQSTEVERSVYGKVTWRF